MTVTECRNCGTITEHESSFLDLSLDIEHNTSLFYCLKNLGGVEHLRDGN